MRDDSADNERGMTEALANVRNGRDGEEHRGVDVEHMQQQERLGIQPCKLYCHPEPMMVGLLASCATAMAERAREAEQSVLSEYRRGREEGIALGAASVVREQLNRSNETPLATVGSALPIGMTDWVAAQDVMRALDCSKTTANEYLRAAAGRSVGTGQLLRVPVDVWEAWARENLVNGRRRRWAGADRTRTPSTSTSAATSGGAGTTTRQAASSAAQPARRTRKQLALGSLNGSERPLIPTLRATRR